MTVLLPVWRARTTIISHRVPTMKSAFVVLAMCALSVMGRCALRAAVNISGPETTSAKAATLVISSTVNMNANETAARTSRPRV